MKAVPSARAKTLLLVFAIILPCPCGAWEAFCIRVADGDSITVEHNGEKIRIRLYGIDCPELKGEPFGRKAKKYTRDMVLGKLVKIEPVDRDRYGRTVAWVEVDGRNLNHELLKTGLAWWYWKYAPNDSTLQTLEESARRQNVGVWSQPNPIPPWEWRKKMRKRP